MEEVVGSIPIGSTLGICEIPDARTARFGRFSFSGHGRAAQQRPDERCLLVVVDPDPRLRLKISAR